jgi:outer membrane protein assembly factor BamB
VVAVNGDILASTNDGVLHALDPRTGRDVWTFDSGNHDGTDLSVSPAVLPSGVIVWPAPGLSLVGLSSAGALLWRVNLHGAATSPAITADGVVVGDSAGWVYAIRVPAFGPATISWSLAVGTGSYGSVALGPGVIFQSVTDGVVALSANGHLRWRHSLPAPAEVSPAATPDGGVVVGAGGTLEYGLDGTGRVRWTHNRRAETYSSPVVTSDGLTAFGDHAGIVTVLDAVTGQVDARYPLLGHRQYPRTIGIWSSPVIDRDHDLYVASFQGHVQGFARDGQRLFDLDTGVAVDSYPALTADGALVVSSTDGTIRLIADR